MKEKTIFFNFTQIEKFDQNTDCSIMNQYFIELKKNDANINNDDFSKSGHVF